VLDMSTPRVWVQGRAPRKRISALQARPGPRPPWSRWPRIISHLATQPGQLPLCPFLCMAGPLHCAWGLLSWRQRARQRPCTLHCTAAGSLARACVRSTPRSAPTHTSSPKRIGACRSCGGKRAAGARPRLPRPSRCASGSMQRATGRCAARLPIQRARCLGSASAPDLLGPRGLRCGVRGARAAGARRAGGRRVDRRGHGTGPQSPGRGPRGGRGARRPGRGAAACVRCPLGRRARRAPQRAAECRGA